MGKLADNVGLVATRLRDIVVAVVKTPAVAL